MKLNTVNELLHNACNKYANNIAIKYKDEFITYEELEKITNKKANYLIEKGVKKEDFIGIIFDHSIELIINIIAVIKSGAAYIPMEPTFPKERINYIIEHAPIKYVLTNNDYQDIVREKDKILLNNIDLSKYNEEYPTDVVNKDNALYVLYTSGTTGKPKGVVIEHRNVVNYVKAFKKEFNINKKDKMLQNSVVTFDIFTEELFPVLSYGGQLIIIPSEDMNDAKKILEFVEKEKITYISSFPYLLDEINTLIKKGMKFPKSLKVMISGGDTLRKQYCSELLDKVKIYNTYGPTETTVVCSYYHYEDEFVDSKTVPIGTSIYGTEMIIVDEKMNKVKPGEIGEICIAGNGVGRGYLNNEEETSKRFIENPYQKGTNMFLSGDLGLLKEDGNIEFIKRKDDQVMIKGKRVEPLEVESLLYKINEVETAIIKSYQDDEGCSYMVGYIKIINSIKINDIKKYLSAYVPEYMIPEFWVKVEEFAKTLNGKIDRKALPIILK